MARVPAKLRTTALLSFGALVVHELRYRLAFGGDTPSALAASGHGYLEFVTPLIVLAGLFFVSSVVQRLGAAPSSRSLRRRHIWLTLAASLVAVFCVQELLEGVFATGHADGVAGVFGQGGWLAVPLSLAAGGLVAVSVQIADRASLRGVATRLIQLAPAPAAVRAVCAAAERRVTPLARHLAGRAPPLPA